MSRQIPSWNQLMTSCSSDTRSFMVTGEGMCALYIHVRHASIHVVVKYFRESIGKLFTMQLFEFILVS